MALSKYVEDETYKNLLRDVKMETRSYEDVARDWETNANEWFHALIAIEDLPIVLWKWAKAWARAVRTRITPVSLSMQIIAIRVERPVHLFAGDFYRYRGVSRLE